MFFAFEGNKILYEQPQEASQSFLSNEYSFFPSQTTTTRTINNNYLTGIIDSGTTCLILPSRFGTKKIYKGSFFFFFKSFVKYFIDINFIFSLFFNLKFFHFFFSFLFLDIYNEFVLAYSSYLYSSSSTTTNPSPPIFITFSTQSTFNSLKKKQNNSLPNEKENENENNEENFTIEIPSTLFTLPNLNNNEPISSSSSSNSNSQPPSLQSLCILSIPEYPSLMILGDVFLKSVVVIHNLTNDLNPTITLIPRKWSLDQEINENYHSSSSFTSSSYSSSSTSDSINQQNAISSLSLTKRYTNALEWSNHRLPSFLPINSPISSIQNFFSQNKKIILPSILPLQNVLGIQYIATIEMGTPIQSNIPVIIDTGSSSLVIM